MSQSTTLLVCARCGDAWTDGPAHVSCRRWPGMLGAILHHVIIAAGIAAWLLAAAILVSAR